MAGLGSNTMAERLSKSTILSLVTAYHLFPLDLPERVLVGSLVALFLWMDMIMTPWHQDWWHSACITLVKRSYQLHRQLFIIPVQHHFLLMLAFNFPNTIVHITCVVPSI